MVQIPPKLCALPGSGHPCAFSLQSPTLLHGVSYTPHLTISLPFCLAVLVKWT